MVVVILVFLGLAEGSFVNALVWRIHEQARQSKGKRAKSELGHASGISPKKLSIMHGRSMCVHCHHQLAWQDLLPVISWITLGGKCRYCKKPISIQYPVVELVTAILFVLSYFAWERPLSGTLLLAFSFWLVTLTGLIALFVYDLKWMLLPNRILFPLYIPGVLFAVSYSISAENNMLESFISALLLGGLFWILFQVSSGKWIGGGDVKLGFLLGLLAGTIENTLLTLFLASLIGSLVAIPLMVTKKLKPTSKLPFGPFLITAAIIAVLYGSYIVDWYNQLFLI